MLAAESQIMARRSEKMLARVRLMSLVPSGSAFISFSFAHVLAFFSPLGQNGEAAGEHSGKKIRNFLE